jgi:diacylglycerol kinase
MKFFSRKRHSTEKYNNLLESTLGAATGLIYAIRTEKKIRQVFVSLVIAMAICLFGDVGYFQILMVVFAWVLALICEIFNTALEKAMDYACGKEFHPLIRQGKDYAGACTFVALVFAVSLTIIVLWGRHFEKKNLRFKTFTVESVEVKPGQMEK